MADHEEQQFTADTDSPADDTAKVTIPAFLREHIQSDAHMHGSSVQTSAEQGELEHKSKHMTTAPVEDDVQEDLDVTTTFVAESNESAGTDVSESSADAIEPELTTIDDGAAENPEKSQVDLDQDTTLSTKPMAVGVKSAREIISPINTRYSRTSDVVDIKQHAYLLIGIFAAAIILFAWITTSFHGCNAQGFVDEQLSTVASRAEDKAVAEAAKEQNAEAEAEAQRQADLELRDTLITIYKDLPNLAAETDQAFADFELYYLQRRMVRQPFSLEIVPLKDKLNQYLSDLDHAKVTTTSEYKEQASLIREALSALIARVDALDKAWEIDLSYAYPSYYIEEIRQPFTNIFNGEVDERKQSFENAFGAIDLGIDPPTVTEDVEQVFYMRRNGIDTDTDTSDSNV